MAITLNLTPGQEAKLKSVAGQLNVSPDDLAETAVRDFLAQPDDEFVKLARTVVEENRELYERLR